MAMKFLLLLLLTMLKALSQSLDLKTFLISRGTEGGRLSKPLVTDDGRFYACSGKNLFAFDSNGTVVWIVPLGYFCSAEIAPVVDERGKIYLIAENRVLKIIPSNIGTSQSTSEVLFGQNASIEGSGEIIGLSISLSYSCLFITIKNRGLFALLPRGTLFWSAGPILYRFGYRQGCKENLRKCFFSSAPVVDQCEGTIYISNTEGQLYSLYIRSPHYRWIQDFSSIDKLMTAIPGNNGLIYVIFPTKASVMALDVYTGNVSWQQNSGPLSTELSLPVVDSNGWLSIGSLDGFLYSYSPNGEMKKLLQATARNSVIQASPVIDCSGFALYASQTIMEGKSSHVLGDYTYISAMKPVRVLFTMLAPATGTVYWTGNYPGELSNLLSKSDLRYFTLDERIFLTFLSSSKIGNSLPCHSMRQKIAWTCSKAKPKFVSMYTGNEKAILLFLLFQLAILVLLGCCVRFCIIFWRKQKLQDLGLVRFLEKRRSLHHKKKAIRRVISELEQKAAEEAGTHETMAQLGEMIKAKEGIERKLSSSYSLGRDSVASRPRSLLPMYDGKAKSHSFHSARKESVTIFNTLSESSTSSEERATSEEGSCGIEGSWQSCEEVEMVRKGKEVEEAGPSSAGNLEPGGASGESSPEFESSGRVYGKTSFAGQQIDRWGRGGMVARRRTWSRRRTLSSTN